MIVYVVTCGHDCSFEGVYSTEEKAKEFVSTLMYPNMYHINEVTVDEAW